MSTILLKHRKTGELLATINTPLAPRPNDTFMLGGKRYYVDPDQPVLWDLVPGVSAEHERLYTVRTITMLVRPDVY